MSSYPAGGPYADLHSHSVASDGTLSPAELARAARKAGLRAFALTDHDTLAGNYEAAREAARLDLTFVPGIELSALDGSGEVHVLGYGIWPGDDRPQTAAFEQIASLGGARDARAQRMLALLASHGMALDFEHLKRTAGDAMLGRPHIARELLRLGHVSSMQQAFDEWLAEGRPAYAPHLGLDPAGAIALIHRAGGVAVLAHPALYAGDWTRLVDRCVSAGVDGVEVWHPSAHAEFAAALVDIANLHNLLVTGGSDFHAPSTTGHANLGEMGVQRDVFEALLARIQCACPPNLAGPANR